MKIIVLSDHIADQLRAKQVERHALLLRYQEAVQRHEDELNRREAALVRAFKDRKVWAAVVCFLKYAIFLFNTGPRAPTATRRGPDREENVWAQGREGEQRVADLLGRMLSDEWTLLAGYKNPKGEIDRILVGPGGFFALEIKYMNGTIFCEGDGWYRDKYDNYGNKVESAVSIQDRGGRSPSVQVNSATDLLQRFLDRKEGAPRILRGIIFSHEKSLLGKISRPTVHFVGTLDEESINKMLALSCETLDAALVRAMIGAIQTDHEYHDRKRRSGSAQPG